jgi:hypothetical protein
VRVLNLASSFAMVCPKIGITVHDVQCRNRRTYILTSLREFVVKRLSSSVLKERFCGPKLRATNSCDTMADNTGQGVISKANTEACHLIL